jgi:taurine dioxygenase
VLGATARGIDLAQSLSERDLGQILPALGRYGVLRFPDQHLDLSELKRFSEQFGEIQGPATRGRDPMRSTSSPNLKEGGKYIGSPDAGQDWHNDMTYREVPGFVNVLYGIRIPHREGKPLGGARGQAGWPSFAIRARPNLGKIRNDGSAGDAVLWSCR